MAAQRARAAIREDALASSVVLVTGAACGIGRGGALELARAGADLLINDVRPKREGEEVAAQMVALGRRARVYQAHVADRTPVDAMTSAAEADFELPARAALPRSGPGCGRGESAALTLPQMWVSLQVVLSRQSLDAETAIAMAAYIQRQSCVVYRSHRRTWCRIDSSG
jgi:NAD(P)-dependent dehydrogenase (short-subunit alcohol dehydrogenase family)